MVPAAGYNPLVMSLGKTPKGKETTLITVRHGSFF
jgi:hypothetical protein